MPPEYVRLMCAMTDRCRRDVATLQRALRGKGIGSGGSGSGGAPQSNAQFAAMFKKKQQK